MAAIQTLFILPLLFSAPAFAEPSQDAPVKFSKRDLSVGKEKITVEVALTEEQLEYGLMYRDQALPENEGMIFIFPKERELTFWMKNTHIPLSVGFFDKKGVLVDIQEMEATSKMDQGPYAQYPSKKPAQFALEMNKGWFKTHGVKVKARLSPLPKLTKGRE